MTTNAIKFQRYYYDDSRHFAIGKGDKIIYDDLLIRDTKANRDIIEKIKNINDGCYDNKGDMVNELIAELEILDEVRITETIEIEW